MWPRGFSSAWRCSWARLMAFMVVCRGWGICATLNSPCLDMARPITGRALVVVSASPRRLASACACLWRAFGWRLSGSGAATKWRAAIGLRRLAAGQGLVGSNVITLAVGVAVFGVVLDLDLDGQVAADKLVSVIEGRNADSANYIAQLPQADFLRFLLLAPDIQIAENDA